MNNLTVPEIIANYCMVDYVSSITPVKKVSNEHECLCLFHDDSKPSMRLYSKNGKQAYKCFVCSVGGDLIDLVKNYNNFDNTKQAIDHLTGRRESTPRVINRVKIETVDIYADFTELPMGDNVILPGQWITVLNPKNIIKKPLWKMKPDVVYRYDNAFVVRLNFSDGSKNTPTIHWCLQKSTGLTGWCCYPFTSESRKPYGEIKPSGTIVIVEGEKAQRAGERITNNRSDISFVTSSGGTNAVDKTDWSALNGRQVIGIPDNDQPGHDYMYKISQKITGMRFVIPDGKPKSWDIADHNFTESELFDFMMSNFGQLRPSEKLTG